MVDVDDAGDQSGVLDDIDDAPEFEGSVEVDRNERAEYAWGLAARKRESSILALLHEASLKAPDNEVLYDAVKSLSVVTIQDAELAVQGLAKNVLLVSCVRDLFGRAVDEVRL